MAPTGGVQAPERANVRPLAANGFDRGWKLIVAAAMVLGVVMRVLALTGHLGGLDSDEAVVGLMARDMLDGDFRAFFWGQDYAGTGETVLVAGVFAVAGVGIVALKSVAVALSAVSALLVWRVARRFVEERTAQVAALLFWVAPTPYIWFATKARGFYWLAMVTGLLVLLAAARIVQHGGRARDWGLLGLAFGIGWWTSPTIAYFAIPTAIWLLLQPSVRSPRGLLRAWPAVPAAAVGAAPWLWHNVATRLASLQQPVEPEHTTYARGLGRLLWQVTPMVLDLRRPISAAWLPGGAVVYLLVLAALAASFVTRRDRPTLILLGLAAFPWIYAIFPGRWFVGEGRYALFLTPFLFIALAWATRSRGAQVALLVALGGLSVLGLRDLGYDRPRHIGDDIAALRAAGVDKAWSHYWLSYRLMFESDLAIVSSSENYQRSIGLYEEIRASDHPAWVYPRTDGRVRDLQAALAQIGVGSRVVQTPNFNVVIADRPVDPLSLPPAVRV